MATRFLTERETAERRKISPRTQQRERAAGGGPPYVRVSARRIAYPEDLLDEWLRARCYPHRAAELAASSTKRAE